MALSISRVTRVFMKIWWKLMTREMKLYLYFVNGLTCQPLSRIVSVKGLNWSSFALLSVSVSHLFITVWEWIIVLSVWGSSLKIYLPYLTPSFHYLYNVMTQHHIHSLSSLHLRHLCSIPIHQRSKSRDTLTLRISKELDGACRFLNLSTTWQQKI